MCLILFVRALRLSFLENYRTRQGTETLAEGRNLCFLNRYDVVEEQNKEPLNPYVAVGQQRIKLFYVM